MVLRELLAALQALSNHDPDTLDMDCIVQVGDEKFDIGDPQVFEEVIFL
jgi:hypothetical protein